MNGQNKVAKLAQWVTRVKQANPKMAQALEKIQRDNLPDEKLRQACHRMDIEGIDSSEARRALENSDFETFVKRYYGTGGIENLDDNELMVAAAQFENISQN